MAAGDETRRRILEAAREEFVALGLSGARIESIARRAGCNKQLLYHHVGDKLALFKAVLREELARKEIPIPSSAASIHDSFLHLFDDLGKSKDRIRLMVWEALAFDGVTMICEEERRCKTELGVGFVDNMRMKCGPFADVESGFLLVAFFALASFPWIMPQVARSMTGMHPTSPGFRKQYTKVLRAFAGLVFDENDGKPKSQKSTE